MDSKRGLRIAAKILALAAISGGYTVVRSRRRCTKCGSWNSHIEEVYETVYGVMIGGIYIDSVPVKRWVRVCNCGYRIRVVREEII